MTIPVSIRPRTGILLALLLGGCIYEPPPPPARRPPAPAPVVEAVPVAPGAYYVWRPGHWRWNGAQWVWVRGRYVMRSA